MTILRIKNFRNNNWMVRGEGPIPVAAHPRCCWVALEGFAGRLT
jgi:hypothetical protein